MRPPPAPAQTWRMPIEESYLEIMKSPIADLKNAGSRYGGAITAAMFLKEFVDTDAVQWAHMDIAGWAGDQCLGDQFSVHVLCFASRGNHTWVPLIG